MINGVNNMMQIEFYTKPSPYDLYNRIVEFHIYTLIIDNDSLIIRYETDTNSPCSEGHCIYKKIKEEFSLKDFFNLKQSKKHRYVLNAQNCLSKMLCKLITK